MFYLDPICGDDGLSGCSQCNAVKTFSRAHDLVVSGRDDVILIRSPNASGDVVITDPIVITKNAVHIRAAGRKYVLAPSSAGCPSVCVTSTDVEIAGLEVTTNACGTDNALNLHGFRTRLNGLFIYCATGNGVEIHCCEACIIKDTKILRSKGYGFKSHNATDWIVQDSYIIGGCTDGIIMIACYVPVADNNSIRGTVIHNNAGYQINIGICVSEFYIDPTSHVGTGGSGRLLDNGISTMDEDVANRTDTIRKIHANRQVITGNQLIIYDDDDVTALFTFDLKDASDVATEDNPKKKVPV